MTKEASQETQVSVESVGAIALVRFANPPHGFMAMKGAAQLRDVLAQVLSDDLVRVVVLTGGLEGVFIRHADVSQIVRAADAVAQGLTTPESFAASPFNEVASMLEAASKPVIAAINGVCMGGGLELALACTIRVASEDVTAIGLPEIRIDIFPGAGGTARLASIIGMHKARLLSLLGTVLTAREARDAGIVDEIAPDALDRAMQIAQELAGRAPAAVRTIMQLAVADARLPDAAAAMGRLLRDEPAIRERLRRFIENGERLDEVP